MNAIEILVIITLIIAGVCSVICIQFMHRAQDELKFYKKLYKKNQNWWDTVSNQYQAKHKKNQRRAQALRLLTKAYDRERLNHRTKVQDVEELQKLLSVAGGAIHGTALLNKWFEQKKEEHKIRGVGVS